MSRKNSLPYVTVPFIEHDDKLRPVPTFLDTSQNLFSYLSKIYMRFICIDNNIQTHARDNFGYTTDPSINYSWLNLQYEMRKKLVTKLLEQMASKNLQAQDNEAKQVLAIVRKVIDSDDFKRDEYEKILLSPLAEVLKVVFVPLTGHQKIFKFGDPKNSFLTIYYEVTKNFTLHLDRAQYRRYKPKICNDYTLFVKIRKEEIQGAPFEKYQNELYPTGCAQTITPLTQQRPNLASYKIIRSETQSQTQAQPSQATNPEFYHQYLISQAQNSAFYQPYLMPQTSQEPNPDLYRPFLLPQPNHIIHPNQTRNQQTSNDTSGMQNQCTSSLNNNDSTLGNLNSSEQAKNDVSGKRNSTSSPRNRQKLNK